MSAVAHVAPAISALFDQANERAPKRSRKSDGTIGDAKHRTRRSWHNPSRPDGTPDPHGMIYAGDLTHDPAKGIDAHAFVRELVARRDKRVLEVISNRQIWTKARAKEGWRRYRGQNPHDKHAHITVDPRHANDVSPWFRDVPKTTQQEDDVLIQVKNDPAIYQLVGDGRVHVSRKVWETMGSPQPKQVTKATLDAIPLRALPKA